MSSSETWRLIVSGRVQGVFYRASAQKRARELGLRGWVRNQSDGRVEALACGPADRLEAFADWCRSGPPRARVTDVVIGPAAESPPDSGFVIAE